MKHKTLSLYVPCLDGGCEDVGRIELDGHTLITDERLWDLEAAEADALEQSRLNGMGSEREAALLAKLEAAEKDIAIKEEVIDALGSELNAVANERDALRTALEKIADWDSAWGPYPETNEAWRAMVIVTAREAVPRRGEKK